MQLITHWLSLYAWRVYEPHKIYITSGCFAIFFALVRKWKEPERNTKIGKRRKGTRSRTKSKGMLVENSRRKESEGVKGKSKSAKEILMYASFIFTDKLLYSCKQISLSPTD